MNIGGEYLVQIVKGSCPYLHRDFVSASLGFKIVMYDNCMNKSVQRKLLSPMDITTGCLCESTNLNVVVLLLLQLLWPQKLCESQQEQPPDFWSTGAAAPEADDPVEDLRFMSTMSSCFIDDSASSPGRDPAILRNRGWRIKVFRKNCQPSISNGELLLVKAKMWVRTLMLNPAFALVSMNIAPCSRAFASPSSVDTFLVTYSELSWAGQLSTSCKSAQMEQDIVSGNGVINWYYKNAWIHRYKPLVDKVSFISDKEDEHIATSLCIHFLDPLWRTKKGLPVCEEWWHEPRHCTEIFT